MSLGSIQHHCSWSMAQLWCSPPPQGMAGQRHLYLFHISFPNQTIIIIHYYPFLYHVTYRGHTAMNRLISQELYWCSRHFTMNPREPVFSEKTGCLYKLSGFFHFRTQALLFTTALGSAPAQIVPPHFKQTVLTGTPDIIWLVSLIIVKCWFCVTL